MRLEKEDYRRAIKTEKSKKIITDFNTHRVLTNEKTIYLTTMQNDILKLLYEHKNNVVKYEEIIEKIYNLNADKTLKLSVIKHIALLNKKLTGYIKIKNIRDVGYIIEEDLK